MVMAKNNNNIPPKSSRPALPTLRETHTTQGLDDTTQPPLPPTPPPPPPFDFNRLPTPTEPPPSPLHLAAQRGDTEATRQLLDSQLAHSTDADHQQITALHWAAINGHVALASLLISRGAVVDAFGGQLHATPLMWAARNGRVQIVHLLLQNGADPNLVDSQAFNSLHLATHSSSALTSHIYSHAHTIASPSTHPIEKVTLHYTGHVIRGTVYPSTYSSHIMLQSHHGI
ncbi:hypothetical protein PCASD_20428 [Puccinia coronata f. sp. avenae]|uniref:protein S-acyltransferase n=1 Tax=Puccinia coronata f. sp. avenae TaxID=200324 RepID=A0A2N5TQN9_9BASI|nr:hypothetical protein PCASD_20428 [Puccinia coronata f. sp. avenae]